MTATASAAEIAAAYEKHRDLIEKIACGFARAYSRPADECIAEANLQFVRAFLTYDPSRVVKTCGLERRIQHLIWNRLRDSIRPDVRREKRHGRAELTDAVIESTPDRPRPSFVRDAFCTGLSDDARAAVALVLDSDWIKVDGDRVSRHLMRRLGWSASRVLAAFDEIRGALT